MATSKQIAANRRNAQRSTGPRTAEGKDRSRWNSLRHGLASIHTVLPHEDPAEYNRIRAGLVDTGQPANAQEQMLVDQIANGYWRMERARRFENAMFHTQIAGLKHADDLPPQCQARPLRGRFPQTASVDPASAPASPHPLSKIAASESTAPTSTQSASFGHLRESASISGPNQTLTRNRPLHLRSWRLPQPQPQKTHRAPFDFGWSVT